MKNIASDHCSWYWMFYRACEHNVWFTRMSSWHLCELCVVNVCAQCVMNLRMLCVLTIQNATVAVKTLLSVRFLDFRFCIFTGFIMYFLQVYAYVVKCMRLHVFVVSVQNAINGGTTRIENRSRTRGWGPCPNVPRFFEERRVDVCRRRSNCGYRTDYRRSDGKCWAEKHNQICVRGKSTKFGDVFYLCSNLKTLGRCFSFGIIKICQWTWFQVWSRREGS